MSGTQANTGPEHLPALIPDHAATPSPAPVRPLDDPDDLDVAAALAEVRTEDAGGQGGTAQPVLTQPQPRRPNPSGTPTPMVPQARMAEVARERNALRDENLYLKGALAVAKGTAPAAPGGTRQPAAVQPTIEQQVAAEASRILAASKQFDAGELSMEQFKVIELRATDIIANLRANHLLAHVQATMPARATVGLADTERLDQHVEEMAAAHPWSAILTDGELSFLANIAKQEAQGLGRPIGTGPAATLRLRQAVAELADVYGPRWYPGHQVQAPVVATAQTPSSGAPQTPHARGAAGQRKVELAARQPPNIATAGHSDAGAGVISEDKIDQMTEDEILALPAAVRDRILSG